MVNGYIKQEYFQRRSHMKIRVEMDEMWSFYKDKQHLDKLLALLAPLKIGKVYTDGNYAYGDREIRIPRMSQRFVCSASKNSYQFGKTVMG